MKRLLLCLALLGGCGTLRTAAETTVNGAAVLGNREASVALDAMCSEELAAIGHRGHRDGTHCVRDDSPRAATPTELAALTRVRAAWDPVVRAYEDFATAHDAVRALVASGEDADSGEMLSALGHMAEAYNALRGLAGDHGVKMPELLGAH